ncbi:hypothetical protein FACS1894219_10260 [Clostridia bacterium]|nr:hypothetical protein FACS1894219_10260 [Clostridia bacterium]
MKIKIPVLLLTVSLMFSVSSCSSENNTDTTATASGNTETVSPTSAREYIFPDENYANTPFTFLTWGQESIYWYERDYYAESASADPIEDAVYRRNLNVEEKYGIEIRENRVDSPTEFTKTAIMSDTVDFDVIAYNIRELSSSAVNGYLVDLHEVDDLGLDNPWWDQPFNESLTLEGKLFFALGDINTQDNDATWAVLFNKQVVQDIVAEDHYELVRNYKWTLDRFHELSRAAGKDLDGDGTLTPSDRVGTRLQYECSYALLAASGEKTIRKDESDLPVVSIGGERAMNVMQKVYDFMNDATAQIKADDPKFAPGHADIWTEINVNGFIEGRALYYISPMTSVMHLRNMEADFGILPLPMYNEAQGKYYSPTQPGNTRSISLPVSGADIERAGIVLNYLSYVSRDTLTAAYYNNQLKTKITRDDESSEMLDIIFGSRAFDLGITFNWGDMQGFYESAVKSQSFDFTSRYEKAAPKFTSAIEQTLTNFQNNV